MSKSSEEREKLLDRIVERWEELRAAGNELSVDALCEGDEGLVQAIRNHPGVIQEAEEEIEKLQRFDRSFGDLVADREALTDDAALVKLANIDEPSEPHHEPADVDDTTRPGEENSDESDHSQSTPEVVGAHRVHPGTRLIIDSRLTVETRFDGGGLGDIYRASDESLRRPVAVKLIRNFAQNRHYTRRFIREATVTAQLSGPGVIPIHGYGTASDGQPFYVMRLIDGDGFDEKIKRFHAMRAQTFDQRRRNSVEFQRLLRYFLSICRTVSYAHDQGVVHCDLKPQNIKIGKYDEVFVLDWGEATSCGSRLDVPRVHSGRISPAYAPPELASASSPPAPTTDIYSLGAIFYELLIGRRLAEDSPNERETKLKSREVPRALASICLKGIELKQQARYESVDEMADDIERWMADEEVSVHRYSMGERVAQSLRRYTTITQIGAVCITALLVLSAVLGLRLSFINAQQEQRHIESLMVSAGLSADSISGEIDRRILFLESLAREIRQEPELMAILKLEASIPESGVSGDSQTDQDNDQSEATSTSDATPNGERNPVIAWFNQRLEILDAPDANSWFVLDRRGTQVAKKIDASQNPETALASIGRNYSYRDYFHGQGMDLDKESSELDNVPPIERPYLCRRYTSSTTNALRVAITVPIFDQDHDIVGVLGMSFNLDELSFVSHRLDEQVSLILVDTRTAADGDVPGVVVVHPGYRSMVLNGFEHGYEVIDDGILGEMTSIASRRLVQLQHVGDGERLPAIKNYTDEFSDPVIGSSAAIEAAFEPVIVRHRGLLIDTGLVAIVRGETQ